jgi:hypothetical protein
MQTKPLHSALFAAILILLITVILPGFFKTWFVQETGNFKFLPGIGPVLAIGLLFRWRLRLLAVALFSIGLVACAGILFMTEIPYQAGLALLIVLQGLLIWVLQSDGLKQYYGVQPPESESIHALSGK